MLKMIFLRILDHDKYFIDDKQTCIFFLFNNFLEAWDEFFSSFFEESKARETAIEIFWPLVRNLKLISWTTQIVQFWKP